MNTEQLRAEFETWWKDRQPAVSIKEDAFAAYQAGRAALQSQAQIPAPTNRDEYIALLDRAIDMGKQLNVMWEEAFAEVGAKHGLQSQDQEDAERYRWLRSAGKETERIVEDVYECALSGEDLDAAIDHARRSEGEAK